MVPRRTGKSSVTTLSLIQIPSIEKDKRSTAFISERVDFELADHNDHRNEILHCYACFSQKRDSTNPRGYFQKSVVFVTRTKLYSFFRGLFEDVAKAYFQEGTDDLLHKVYHTMNFEWPQPHEIPDIFEVTLLGKKYEVGFIDKIKSEKNTSYKHRFSESPTAKNTIFGNDVLCKKDDEDAPLSLKKSLGSNRNHGNDKEHELDLPKPFLTINSLCDDFKNINLFQLMGRQKVCLILKLWEIVMLNESLLILADSPLVCR